MSNPDPIAMTLRVNVVVTPDDRDEPPPSAEDQLELGRHLLNQVTVIKAAIRRLEELRRGTPSDQPDEPGNKQP